MRSAWVRSSKAEAQPFDTSKAEGPRRLNMQVVIWELLLVSVVVPTCVAQRTITRQV